MRDILFYFAIKESIFNKRSNPVERNHDIVSINVQMFIQTINRNRISKTIS